MSTAERTMWVSLAGATWVLAAYACLLLMAALKHWGTALRGWRETAVENERLRAELAERDETRSDTAS